MRDLTIRPERREHHDAIAAVQRAAFDAEGPRHHRVRGDLLASQCRRLASSLRHYLQFPKSAGHFGHRRFLSQR